MKIEDSKEGFDFVAEYTKENTWEYTVKGQLPSPCHKTSVETLILESYPEQVSVVLKIAKPEEDTACVQVIEEFEEKGQFTASEKGKVILFGYEVVKLTRSKDHVDCNIL